MKDVMNKFLKKLTGRLRISVELRTLWLMLKCKKIDCNRKVNADCFSHFIENLGQQSTQNICAPFIKQFLWKLQKIPWLCTHVLIIWNVDTGKRLRNDVVITLDYKICILSIVFSGFFVQCTKVSAKCGWLNFSENKTIMFGRSVPFKSRSAQISRW